MILELLERGEFLRRARYAASTLMLAVLLGCALSAQLAQPRNSQENDAATKRQEDTNHQLSAIVGELAAIRQQNQGVYWPPIWSNWVLAAFAAIAAIIAVWSLDAIKRQAIHTEQAAKAAEEAAQAATDGNQIQRAFMIADQRPWVSLEVEVVAGLFYGVPEGRADGDQWHAQLNYRLKNHGKTPAVRVGIFAKLVPSVIPTVSLINGLPEDPIPGTNVSDLIESACSFVEDINRFGHGFGRTMFPAQEDVGTFHASFKPEGAVPRGYSGQFVIAVGVAYRSTVSDENYRTAKTLVIFKREGQIDLRGEAIPANALRTAPWHGSHGSVAT